MFTSQFNASHEVSIPNFYIHFLFPNVCTFFKVCKSVNHRTIQINHQPDATIFQFIILTFIYGSTCFGRFPAHHQELNDCSGSLWFYLRIVVTVVLCSWSGRSARPRIQHGYHHDTKVKPEAATAVIKLLMMGGKTPETCWAVNKCQDNKLENCSIWLVIYLNCTMMHGLTNLKLPNTFQRGTTKMFWICAVMWCDTLAL